MSEMDFALSCCILARGGEVEVEESEGRVPVTELSARDLSCSDQLKPCWSARDTDLSEKTLVYLVLLASGTEELGIVTLPRRPAAEKAAETPEPSNG